MQCKKIQELLKADYFDGEATPEKKQHIEGHLRQCAQCSALQEALLAQREIFQKAERLQPPEGLWDTIRDAITAQDEGIAQESGARRSALDWLRNVVAAPRPVFALASVLAAMIFILVFARTFVEKKQLVGTPNVTETIIGYSLNGSNGDFVYDLGTDVEKYFL